MSHAEAGSRGVAAGTSSGALTAPEWGRSAIPPGTPGEQPVGGRGRLETPPIGDVPGRGPAIGSVASVGDRHQGPAIPRVPGGDVPGRGGRIEPSMRPGGGDEIARDRQLAVRSHDGGNGRRDSRILAEQASVTEALGIREPPADPAIRCPEELVGHPRAVPAKEAVRTRLPSGSERSRVTPEDRGVRPSRSQIRAVLSSEAVTMRSPDREKAAVWIAPPVAPELGDQKRAGGLDSGLAAEAGGGGVPQPVGRPG